MSWYSITGKNSNIEELLLVILGAGAAQSLIAGAGKALVDWFFFMGYIPNISILFIYIYANYKVPPPEI